MNMSTSPADLKQAFSSNPAFQSVEQELLHKRQVGRVKWPRWYPVGGAQDGSDDVTGGQTISRDINIEGGLDFYCEYITGSAFSFDAGNATDFPMPNSNANTSWAMRGLQVRITDSGSGRQFTSDFVAWENLFTPGYGTNFLVRMPFRHLFKADSTIRFDVRNTDNANRTVRWTVLLHGMSYLTPSTITK